MTVSQDRTASKAVDQFDAQETEVPRHDDGQGGGGSPLSRRAALRRERDAAKALAEGQEHPSGVVAFSDAPQINSTADIWDTISRATANELVEVTERRSARRHAEARPEVVEAPTHAPVSRPSVPSYAGGGRRRPAAGGTETPAFRTRDYSQRSTDDAQPFWVTDGVDYGADLEYRTQLSAPPLTAAPVEPEPLAALPVEHTMTRRQLRELEQQRAEEAARGAATATPAAALPVTSAFVAAPSEQEGVETVAMSIADKAEFDADATVTAPITMPRVFASLSHAERDALVDEAPAADEDAFDDGLQAVDTPGEPLFVPVGERDDEDYAPEVPSFLQVAAPTEAEPATEQIAHRTEAEPTTEQVAHRTEAVDPFLAEQAPVAPRAPLIPRDEPVAQESAAAPAPRGFEALIQQASARLDPNAPVAETPQPAAANHWSLQSPEEESGPVPGFGRNIATPGHGQNALIVDKDPQPGLMQALNGTGELFITGSYDLPSDLARRGSTDQHDSSDLDFLYDGAQEQQSSAAPVRASRAVSTHTSTRSVVSTKKQRGGAALPTVLAVTAAVLAVSVVGLFLFQYFLG